jgi:hypothetical protein
MSTNPVEELLPPIHPAAKSALEQFGSLVDETIAFGTHVLKWQMDSATGGDEVAPITLSIRHILDMLAAVSSCVKSSNIDPCKSILRATLESFLGLAYLLKEDSSRRGFAFLAVEASQRLKHVKMLDPSTTEGDAFRKALESDTVVPGFVPNISPEVIKTSLANTEAFLASRGVREAVAELKRLKKKNKNSNPHWYSLYGGPTNLERLATSLGYQSLYLVYYKHWSRSTHGIDVVQGKLGPGPSGRPRLIQLRVPTEAQTATQFAVTLALKMFRLIVDKYCPEKQSEFASWYSVEVRQQFLALGDQNLLNVSFPK